MGLIVRIGTVLAAVAAGGWLLVQYAVRPHQCNAGISELRARTNAAAETADSYARLVRARRNLEDLARLREQCPTAVRIPMLIGSNEEMAGRLDEATRAYQAALALDRRPEIHRAIADVALQQGRIDEAVAHYAAAVRFAPVILEDISSPDLRERVIREVRQAERAAREK